MPITEKIIETKIDVDNETQLCENIDENVRSILNTKFAKKCFMGVYIMEVLDIINKSDPEIIGNGSNIKISMSVRFKIRAKTFNTGDLILAKVVQKRPQENLLWCEIENGFVYLKMDEINGVSAQTIYGSFQKDQYLPVIIDEKLFQSTKDVFSLNGRLFTPRYKEKVYQIMPFTQSGALKLELARLSAVEKQYNIMIKDNASRNNFFIKIYNYHEIMPVVSKKIDLLELAKGEFNGVIADSPDISFESRYIKVLNIEMSADVLKIDYNPELIIMALIHQYISRLEFLLEMNMIFTDTVIKSSTNLWKVLMSFHKK